MKYLKYVKTIVLLEDVQNPGKDGRSKDWNRVASFEAGTKFSIFATTFDWGDRVKYHYVAVEFGRGLAASRNIAASTVLEASHDVIDPGPVGWIWVSGVESGTAPWVILERLVKSGAVTPSQVRVTANAAPEFFDAPEVDHEYHDRQRQYEPACELCIEAGQDSAWCNT